MEFDDVEDVDIGSLTEQAGEALAADEDGDDEGKESATPGKGSSSQKDKKKKPKTKREKLNDVQPPKPIEEMDDTEKSEWMNKVCRFQFTAEMAEEESKDRKKHTGVLILAHIPRSQFNA